MHRTGSDKYSLFIRFAWIQAIILIALGFSALSLADDKCKLPGADNNLAEAKAFLEKNKNEEGVITTPSGMQYKILREGRGNKNPRRRDTVVAHYELTNLNGEKLQSSYDNDKPIQFEVTRVIKGWTEALLDMKVGEKRTLFIPPKLAYGCKGTPPIIGPNELLIFDMELTHIVEYGQ